MTNTLTLSCAMNSEDKMRIGDSQLCKGVIFMISEESVEADLNILISYADVPQLIAYLQETIKESYEFCK